MNSTILNPSLVPQWFIYSGSMVRGISGADGREYYFIGSSEKGADGKTPALRAESANNYKWEVNYDNGQGWIEVPGAPVASGLVGPQGETGDAGTSVIVQSIETVAGGTQVTVAWGEGFANTSSFLVPSGTPGANGKDGKDGKDGTNGTNGQDGANGISPTVTTATIEGTPGGVEVTISGADGKHTFNILNGQDGAGASYNFDGTTLSGNGSTTDIGVNTTAAMNFTNASAKSATYAEQYFDPELETNVIIAEQFDTVFEKFDAYVPFSAKELAIGSGNTIETAYAGNTGVFLQGTNNTALNNSHCTFAQGDKNFVSHSQGSLLQGFSNSATNYYNFAQGAQNDASTYSLTQGANNTANSYSQAAGQANSAITASVAFGNANTAKDYSVAQGENNSACDKTFAQGVGNSGYYCSLVQGYHNSAYNYGLAQGYQNTAEYECLAQGYGNYAGKSGGSHSLAQGYSNSAVYQSMAQGYMNTAWYDSFAQGFKNSAFDNSMAQGLDNTAHKFGAAIGEHNTADEWSIAHGMYTNAYSRSQAFGFRTIASGVVVDGNNYGMMAIGCGNATTAGALFVAGNGYLDEHSNLTRSDAFIIYRDGSVSAAGKISANGVELGAGGAALTIPLNIYSTATNTVSNNSIGAIGNNCVVGKTSLAISNKYAAASGNAFAFGDDNVAYDNSLAFGWGTTATLYSFAGGQAVSANDRSVALGNGNTANVRSFAFGDANTATYWSVAVGRGLALQGSTNASTGFGGLVVGGWNKTSADALFVAGNGTGNGNSRSDAAVLTKTGVWSAADFRTFTGNNNLSEKISTTDSPHGSNLKAELAVIAFSDNEIVSFVTGGGCSGKGTLIFRVG